MSVFRTKEFADAWHRRVQENSAVRIHLLNPKIEKSLGSLDGKRVVDLGCGDGFSTSLLVGKNAKVVCVVDVNPWLIRIARSGLKGKIRFVAADLSRVLPLATDSFDTALCCNVLTNIDDGGVANALAEIARILKQGRRLVATITHPLYNLFVNQREDEKRISEYAENREIRVDSIPGFDEFVEYRRPLSWYFRQFLDAGFAIEDFQEIAIGPFDGMQERYASRMGYPIFALFRLRNM